MKQHAKLLSNAASLYALQAINYLVPIFTFPYLIRMVGLDGFGRLSRVLAIVQAATLAVGLAYNYTASARMARETDAARRSELYWSVTSTRIVLLLAAISVLMTLTFVLPSWAPDRALFATFVLLMVGEASFPMWMFMGLERLGFVTLLNGVARAVSIGVLLIFVRSPEDIQSAALVMAGPVFFSGIGSWAILGRLGISWRPTPNRELMWETFVEAARAFAGTFPSHIYARGSVIILGSATTDYQFGLYSMANRIAGLISSFVAPAAQTVYATICRSVESDEQYRAARNRTLALGLGALLSVAIGVGTLAPWILRLIAGSEQPLGEIYLRTMLPTVLFSGISVLMNLFVMATSRFGKLFRIYVVASSVFLLLAFPLTAQMGVPGMIVTMVIVEGIVTLGMVLVSSRGVR